MIYAMSDIHGCYDLYTEMLGRINFSDSDTLFVLGDTIDRGDDGIKILSDMMNRKNIVPIIGNHEYMAYSVMKKVNENIKRGSDTNDNSAESMIWMYNGGAKTLGDFIKLDRESRERIIDYIGSFEAYCELEADGNDFVLLHGGLKDFSQSKRLGEYDIDDIVWHRCNYDRQYYSDKYLVTGHTPTCIIDPYYEGRIYKKNNHIAIDCGAVFLGRLGCICLNTLEEFYTDN